MLLIQWYRYQHYFLNFFLNGENPFSKEAYAFLTQREEYGVETLDTNVVVWNKVVSINFIDDVKIHE
jgi:hypothetical protein